MKTQKMISDLLKETGWSYRKLAKELGVSKTTISRWHKGECKPSHPYYEEQLDYLLKNVEKKEELKHKFKVGERVQFKSWEEMADKFRLDYWGDIDGGKYGFLKEMIPLCGTFATIERLSPDSTMCELTDFSYKGDTNYVYETYMLKPVEQTQKETELLEPIDKLKLLLAKENYSEFMKILEKSKENKISIIDNEIKFHEQKLAELKAQKEKEKWKFTEDEKVILRNLANDIKYICRDSYGLKVSECEPYRMEPPRNGWYQWYIPVAGLSGTLPFEHLFACIKVNDSEPCEFRKFI